MGPDFCCCLDNGLDGALSETGVQKEIEIFIYMYKVKMVVDNRVSYRASEKGKTLPHVSH